MNLDVKTIIFLTAVSAMLVSASMFVTSINFPQIKGVKRWAAACGVHGLGWLLLGLRGEIPDLFSIVFANVVIIASGMQFYSALAVFKGIRPRYRLVFVTVAVYIVAFLFFYFIQPSFLTRSMLTSALGAAITFCCGYILVVGSKSKTYLGEWVMSIGFFAISGLAFLRLLDFGIYGAAPNADIFSSGFFQSIVFGLFFVSILLQTFSFSFVINDKFMSEIMRLATHDSLTETFNRAAMEKLIFTEIERARRYELDMSFLLLDLDHFKRVNDTFGHQVGDSTLKKVVKVINTELREHDMLGRFGGEEFTVLLPETALKEAEIVAERIRQTVEQTEFKAGHKSFKLTISIGLAAFNREKDDFQGLFKRADLGLYKAKQTGRNQVVAVKDHERFSSELTEAELSAFEAKRP